jgi:para-aminobenzoate synthetase/4-amino-4-deoxychorismate lyase
LAAVEAFVDFPWTPTGSTGQLAFGEPIEVIRADCLAEVRPALAAVRRAAMAGRYAVGFLAYEAAPAFDPAMRVRAGSRIPLVWFAIHDTPRPDDEIRWPTAYACSAWRSETDEERYGRSVTRVREAIARGDTYQVNYTMPLHARFAGDPLGVWADLRRAQQHGWFAYLDIGSHAVASVSPELFFTWDGAQVVTRPMKGTRSRRLETAGDAALARQLRTSAKDRAENLMIVDLLRNDVARVSRPGSVRVPALFEIEDYPTVWQMTSTVTGQGRDGLFFDDIIAALFPCGSVTGAPKVRTMELITEVEDRPRGVYCGAAGVVWPGGSAAFNVAIRTLVVDREAGLARYDVGGGVVWDSDSATEHAEALAKAAVLAQTQRDAGLLETIRVERGVVVLRDRHLDRLAASAAWFRRPFDRSLAGRLLDDLATETRTHTVGCDDSEPGETPADTTALRGRLVLALNGTLTLDSTELPESFGMPCGPHPDVVRHFALAHRPVDSTDPWLRHKTTDRTAYERLRRDEPGLFDTLLWNERGELTEFTIGNLVVELGGELVTPPEDCGLLPGTLRAEILDYGAGGRPVVERVLTREDLTAAQGIWLVNAVRGWVPVTFRYSGA